MFRIYLLFYVNWRGITTPATIKDITIFIAYSRCGIVKVTVAIIHATFNMFSMNCIKS